MSYAHYKNAFSKSKVFAFVLSLCMILTMFPVYAFAEGVPNYKTLDEIPEDVAIFRAIRLGNISARWLNGELYYQFDHPDYPRVRIKASAFMNQPNNNYLNADNVALSLNCQNESGASRVCYYKAMTTEKNPYTGENVYIFSMYRLELTAKVNKGEGVLDTDVKLTSGTTFVYTPTAPANYALQHVDTIPLRPGIAVDAINEYQDVSLMSYETQVRGISAKISDAEKAEIIKGSIGCGVSVLSAIIAALDPEPISKAALASTAVSTAGACLDPIVSVLNLNKEGILTGGSSVYRCGVPITIPAKLARSENHMLTSFKLNCRNFEKAKTQFFIVFSFSNA